MVHRHLLDLLRTTDSRWDVLLGWRSGCECEAEGCGPPSTAGPLVAASCSQLPGPPLTPCQPSWARLGSNIHPKVSSLAYTTFQVFRFKIICLKETSSVLLIATIESVCKNCFIIIYAFKTLCENVSALKRCYKKHLSY